MANISIKWHGHGTYSLDIDGTKVVVDPFFAPNNPAAQVTQEEVAADVILVTHGHGDHVADLIPLAERTGAKVICNFEIGNWLMEKGIENVHQQHLGGGFQHDFAHVKMTVALHGSGLPDGSYGGMPGGFLISTDDKTLYIAGDTALFSDMQLIGNAGIDTAILPIGDNFTMGIDDSIEAVKYLRPKVAIPCHYSTWPPIEQDANAWAERVESETDAKAVVLEIEGTYSV